MPEQDLDANQSATSSTAEENLNQQEGGELGDQLSSTDNAGTNDKSLADFVQETVKPTDDREVEAAEASDSKIETDEGENEKPQSEKEAQDGGEKEASAVEKEIVEGQPVPYERFQSVIGERETLKRQIAEELTPQVENWKRIVGECRKRDITAEQFENMVRIQGLLNQDPEKALPELERIVDQLRGFTGGKLPSDLQAKVDKGTLEMDDAVEMAQLRARQEFGTKKSERDQRVMAERQAADLKRQTDESIQSWISAKTKTDPDFKIKGKEADVDGLYEDTFTKFHAMLYQQDARGNYLNPCQTPAEVVALMERAYTSVKAKWTTRLTPKAPTRKVLSSNGASTHSQKATRIEDAKTMAEAVEIALNERK